MVIFHGTEWDTDGETHPNNPIPLIFKHPFDGLKRWCNFPTKPWFLRGVEHERGKGFISNNRGFRRFLASKSAVFCPAHR